jgi:hypothetical protein
LTTIFAFSRGLTTTTPLDRLKLLRLVMLPNGLLTVSSRVYEYEPLRHVIAFDRWSVSAGLDSDAAAALKTAGSHTTEVGRSTASARSWGADRY